MFWYILPTISGLSTNLSGSIDYKVRNSNFAISITTISPISLLSHPLSPRGPLESLRADRNYGSFRILSPSAVLVLPMLSFSFSSDLFPLRAFFFVFFFLNFLGNYFRGRQVGVIYLKVLNQAQESVFSIWVSISNSIFREFV